jgi:uncharacterized membrane protein
MRRFAFSYYVGIGLLVFLLYAAFLRAIITPGEHWWLIGVIAGAAALILILIAIYVAWRGNGYAKE